MTLTTPAMLDGKQIVRNCRLKARIIGRRNAAAAMRGERDDTGPAWGDIESAELAKAFDRLRARLSLQNDKDSTDGR